MYDSERRIQAVRLMLGLDLTFGERIQCALIAAGIAVVTLGVPTVIFMLIFLL